MTGNKTVLVTGCSSGFGYEAAKLLAQRGFRVFATMRNPEQGRELEAAATGFPGELIVRELDVTDKEQIRQIVDEAASNDGLEAVVNNAGIAVAGFLEDLDEEHFRRVFETNFFGTLNVTQAAIPHMKARGHGTIVQVTSAGGRFALPTMSAYAASKHAVEGMSESLSHELQPLGIRVVLVEPGLFKTEMVTGDNKELVRGRNGDGPNAEAIEKVDENTTKVANRMAGNPKRVAKTIVKVIESPRPRLRYPVGFDARLFVTVKRFLPFRLMRAACSGVLRSAGYPDN